MISPCVYIMVKIKQVTENDRKKVLQLVRKLYSRKAPEQVKKWEKEWDSFKKYTIVAIIANKLVGYLFYLPKYKSSPKALYISDLYVLPKHRRQGIAEKLVKKAEKIAVKQKKKLIVDTQKKNASSLGLYKKLGFEIWKEKSSQSWTLQKR